MHPSISLSIGPCESIAGEEVFGAEYRDSKAGKRFGEGTVLLDVRAGSSITELASQPMHQHRADTLNLQRRRCYAPPHQ